MFILSTLEDNVRIAPQDLGKPLADAVTGVLEQTFLDKVVPGLGLVVTLYDLLEVGGGHVYHSDGGAHHTVRFRVVVFRPFLDETLVGRVKRMSEEGIDVDLGFFEDVFIPKHGMPEPSFWHEEDKAWVWRYEGQDLFFELGHPVRVKVRSVRFNTLPTLAEHAEQREAGEAAVGTKARPYVPMQVLARANEEVLGMLHWYAEGGSADDPQD